MATKRGAAGQQAASRSVSVRLPEGEHAAVAAAAAATGISVAGLVRALVRHGLGELERGNTDVLRAVKTSRDA